MTVLVSGRLYIGVYRTSIVPITEALQHLKSITKHTLTAALICRGIISYPHFARGGKMEMACLTQGHVG